VVELTLEYQTDLLTYYVLPNITKAMLCKKSDFMERNRAMLGLMNFEFVTLPAFEVAARDIPSTIRNAVREFDFEESVEDQEFGLPKAARDNGEQIDA